MTDKQTTDAALFAGVGRLSDAYSEEAFYQEHGETMEVWKRRHVNHGMPEQSAEAMVRNMANAALEKKTDAQTQPSVQLMKNIQEGQRAAKKQEAENEKQRNKKNV